MWCVWLVKDIGELVTPVNSQQTISTNFTRGGLLLFLFSSNFLGCCCWQGGWRCGNLKVALQTFETVDKYSSSSSSRSGQIQQQACCCICCWPSPLYSSKSLSNANFTTHPWHCKNATMLLAQKCNKQINETTMSEHVCPHPCLRFAEADDVLAAQSLLILHRHKY